MRTGNIATSVETKVYEIVTIHGVEYAVLSEPGNALYLTAFGYMGRIGNRIWETSLRNTVGASRRA